MSVTLVDALRHFERGVEAARRFFNLGPDVRITVITDCSSSDDAAADIRWIASRLEAEVRLDVAFLSKNPERIWPAAAHEVAHLVGRELMWLTTHDWMKDHEAEFTLALEQQTRRLERVFLRHVPDPLESFL